MDDEKELKLQGEKLKKAKSSKYLGLTVSSNGRCKEEVRRIQAGWMNWKKVPGVLCDRKLSARVKSKMYKSVVRSNGNCGSDGKTGEKNGSCRFENGEMGTGSDKKEQDKKQIPEKDCKNRKARRQILECKAMLVKRREG